MKKVILTLFCIACFISIQAQARFGVKAGLNLANITDSDGGTARIGFNGGVQVGIPVTRQFSVQPELMYSAQGMKTDDDVNVNFSYINAPILFQYDNPSGFFAHTGPQIGFLLSAKLKQGSAELEITDAFKSTDYAWVFGAGYRFSSGFGFNGRYNLGLSEINEDGSPSKHVVIQLGLFYIWK